MCGRYTLTVTLEELMLHFYSNVSSSVAYQPRFNISPSQMVLAVIHDGHENRIGPLKWGLLPSWAKDEKTMMTNARAETLKDKPAFKVPFARKRCLIPADSFYEWKQTNEGKQPMRVLLKSEKMFSMAGLYDTWIAPDGRKVSSCTIITTMPNSLVADIHNRMPVILTPQNEAVWLNREIQDMESLLPLLKPFPTEEMKAYPVSPMVGNAKNDVPECIQEVMAGG
ncbi:MULTISPECIES: SOS response-associated peptidase [unclassified Paenibacillus]|uniref:SOS response-associated peptidase n=1 Tax=unclassified Paenibacillus TaxID=185978 RepID=UPI001AE82520|nr:MULTISPECIES: SOS response-associated peptidase [unclassified Paenibacillus]MBP1153782.1 putative SOS response-associated peptidase YedK [Paenibacillus sp. PvP091]MBP1170833.1 putative SOS response-associated peptidase YedK [Paenibacillus sp. PvR098]MBP2441861.1 putative SOS response-associated peptidase YedK [Paenibacillus sp. PvP052]